MAGPIVRWVPSLITFANVLAGLMAIVAAFEGWTKLAIFLIFMGFFADTADGPLARWLDATSDFGKELDSMGDLITFGVAPFVLLYTISTSPLMLFVASIYALAAVFRLARFNSQSSPQGQHLGLATPFAALLIAAGVALGHPSWALSIVAIVCSILMVTTRRYLKPGTRRDRRELIAIWVVHLLGFTLVLAWGVFAWLDEALISAACQWGVWGLVVTYVVLGGTPVLKL